MVHTYLYHASIKKSIKNHSSNVLVFTKAPSKQLYYLFHQLHVSMQFSVDTDLLTLLVMSQEVLLKPLVPLVEKDAMQKV